MTIQETSREAYELADRGATERRVLRWLRRCGVRGSTDDEGWRATGLLKDSYAPARNALVKAGLVGKAIEQGKVLRRPTKAGRTAMVWRLVSKETDEGGQLRCAL